MAQAIRRRVALAALLMGMVIGLDQTAAAAAGVKPVQLMGDSPEEAFSRPQDAALARAAAQGDIAAIERAVAAGADVNALDRGHSSPLIWAMTHHREASVVRLLELGADPNQRVAKEYTPLYLATTPAYSPAMLAALLKHGGDANYRVTKNTALMNCVLSLEKIALLVAHGADVNYVDEFGDSALQFAADLDAWATVSYLLENGWRGDLARVARYAQRSRVRAPRAVAELERAKSLMEQRGIRFPVPERVAPTKQ